MLKRLYYIASLKAQRAPASSFSVTMSLSYARIPNAVTGQNLFVRRILLWLGRFRRLLLMHHVFMHHGAALLAHHVLATLHRFLVAVGDWLV
jgi:hypothetical protein